MAAAVPADTLRKIKNQKCNLADAALIPAFAGLPYDTSKQGKHLRDVPGVGAHLT